MLKRKCLFGMRLPLLLWLFIFTGICWGASARAEIVISVNPYDRTIHAPGGSIAFRGFVSTTQQETFTLNSLTVYIDGNPYTPTTYSNYGTLPAQFGPTGLSSINGSISWPTAGIANPSEHFMYAIASITYNNNTYTIDSRSSTNPNANTPAYAGDGRMADFYLANIQFQSVTFGGGALTLRTKADTTNNGTTVSGLVPVPQITWTQSGTTTSISTYPAGYVRAGTPQLICQLNALSGSATMGYTMTATASPIGVSDAAITLKNTGTSVPVSFSGNSFTVASDNALLNKVERYSVSFTDLSVWLYFTLAQSWGRACNYASATSPVNTTFYATLAQPVAPMEQPWVAVLGDACTWAVGDSDAATATSDLTTKFYNNAHYNGGNHAFTDPFTDTQETFHLNQFLTNNQPYPLYGECNDFSDFMVCLSSALGAVSLQCQRSATLTAIDSGAEFTTNPILAAPNQIPTTPSAVTWDYHQWNTNGSIYDSCLRFSGVTQPINMSGPDVGSTYYNDLIDVTKPIVGWGPISSFLPTIAN